MPISPEVRIVDSAADLFQAAAEEFSQIAAKAIRSRGRFTVALSGGSTPRGLYSLLASGKFNVAWDKTLFFWSDERHVPPTDAESNFHMANEILLSKIGVPPQNIFRVPAEEKNADAAARAYEDTLRAAFGLKSGEIPRFDLILLGIGTEGHTASLFPGSPALEETARLVTANWVEKLHTARITFTYPLLNNAACVIFLVSGAEKADILEQIFEGTGNLPAQKVCPVNGRLLWIEDHAAAAKLPDSDWSAAP